MPRSIPEWVGRTDDAMPPPRVRLRIFERHGGRCYICTIKLGGSQPWDLDHIEELADGGKNEESNMAPACPACHKQKTATSATERATSRRHRMRAAGIKRKTRKLPYRRFDGTIVWPK